MHDALLAAPLADAVACPGSDPRVDANVLIVLPADEPCPPGFRAVHTCERRDWTAGVHAGDTLTYHGHVPREQLATATPGAA